MPRPLTAATLVVAALLLSVFGHARQARQAPPAPPQAPAQQAKPEEPPFRGLDSALYMQTSAEYRAACYQAYRLASLRLKALVAEKPPGQLAVVCDLDETVFDNGAFLAERVRSGVVYQPASWDEFQEKGGHSVRLLPGVREFFADAAALEVQPVFVSNRTENYRTQVEFILARLGLPGTHVALSAGPTDTDKTARRQQAEGQFNVLLYLGDNLRDFDEAFRFPNLDGATPDALDDAIATRKGLVDLTREKWGDRWIIFPNPGYGEWTKPMTGGKGDVGRLARPAAK